MRLQPGLRRSGPAAAALGGLILVLSLFSTGGELRVQAAPGLAAPGDRFPVVETTIADVHRAIREGRLTVRALIQAYLDRIAAYDQPSGLNALVIVNPKALEAADALDAEFKKTRRLRPLHGIPVIVKDNYDTFDLPTSAGSLALADSIPPDDATVVKKLREAGAVVLAKSNMAEWAFSPYLTDSSLAGVTRNPYDQERVPAGSSGGTAAAVAANLGLVGLGTDTGNSIRGPSSHCALVGLRPTMGLVSRDGIVPLYLRNDMGGPMTRTVEDAARVLSVIAGVDQADPLTRAAQGRIERDYTRFLDRNGLKKARIGVFRTFADAPRGDAAVKALFDQALADMAAAGAEIVDPLVVPDFAGLTKSLWCDMFGADVDAYLASRGPSVPFRTLADIVASGLFLPANERRMRQALAADRTANAGCLDLYRDPRTIKLREAVLAAMDKDRLDAIVYPTWSNVPRRVGDLESPAGDNSQIIPPHTGLPGISVPMGFSEGRWPAGLQIVGRLFGDGSLLKIAYAYEQAARHRRPPDGFPELGAPLKAENRPASPFAFEVQATPVEGTIRALEAVSATTAWASGSRGSVLRTVDGGRTWEARPVPGAEKLDFRSLAAFDAERAVVANAGSPGFIYKTATAASPGGSSTATNARPSSSTPWPSSTTSAGWPWAIPSTGRSSSCGRRTAARPGSRRPPMRCPSPSPERLSSPPATVRSSRRREAGFGSAPAEARKPGFSPAGTAAGPSPRRLSRFQPGNRHAASSASPSALPATAWPSAATTRKPRFATASRPRTRPAAIGRPSAPKGRPGSGRARPSCPDGRSSWRPGRTGATSPSTAG